MEEGDFLDSCESDTGNPTSGDSVTLLYAYEGSYWLVDGTHCTADEYSSEEEAMQNLHYTGDDQEDEEE